MVRVFLWGSVDRGSGGSDCPGAAGRGAGRLRSAAGAGVGARGSEAVGVDAANPLPVAPVPMAVTYLDRSGAIAVAGAGQTVAIARATRRGFFVQNLSAGDLWIGFGTAAMVGAPAIRLAAGQLYESPTSGVPADTISIAGAVVGQAFTAKEW